MCRLFQGMDNHDFDRMIGLPLILLILFAVFLAGPGRADGRRWLLLLAVGLGSFAGCGPDWTNEGWEQSKPWRSQEERRIDDERSERLAEAAILGTIALVVVGCGAIGFRLGVDDGEPMMLGALGLLVGIVIVVFWYLGSRY